MSTILEHPPQQAVTVRVVFDGGPCSGKTTAARSLGSAMAVETISHTDEDGRTAWFDWMTYSGGQYQGAPVRVELVTVPSPHELAHRRRHLINWGDVVVFIADSTHDGLSESAARFAELRDELEERRPIPLVVVANKRDAQDLAPLNEVRESLGLRDNDVLVEGIATSGGGIQEALIYAVRAAIEQSLGRPDATLPDDLLRELESVPATETIPIDENAPEPIAEPADVALMQDVCLNRHGVAEGAAVIVMQEHWKLLVEIANGRSEISFANADEAATALELATWGLITGTQEVRPPGPEIPDPVKAYHDGCELRRTMEIDSLPAISVPQEHS